jgi:hypothetical protein
MPIKTNGTLSVQDIVDEFGGVAPHSVSEYYRGAGLVPLTPNTQINNSIPTGGTIRHSNFYSSSRTVIVFYDIIGGGGGGGAGAADREPRKGTFAPSGESTIISGSGISTITAQGGTGGENHYFRSSPYLGQPGFGTIYGPGGSGGSRNSGGGDAPETSYGAGGGGAGGDAPSTFDNSGAQGAGGQAGTRLTGSFVITYGTTLNLTIGGAGPGDSGPSYRGGNGAAGFIRITYEGITREFTTSGSTVIN